MDWENYDDYEIIAPAGRLCDIPTIMESGADAIYVGLESFSARPSSCDLNVKEVIQAAERVKAGEKRLYVAVNGNIPNARMSDVCESISFLDQNGVDAFIISDFGLLTRIRKYNIYADLHASTLLGCYNRECGHLLQKLEVKRIILSSDLYIDEIASLMQELPDLKYELIVDGRICFNSNRQCLLPHCGHRESYSGFCQQDYNLLDGERILGEAKKICNSPNQDNVLLGMYMAMGITSFKIEGRTKNLTDITQRVQKLKESKEYCIENASELKGCWHYINRQGGV